MHVEKVKAIYESGLCLTDNITNVIKGEKLFKDNILNHTTKWEYKTEPLINHLNQRLLRV